MTTAKLKNKPDKADLPRSEKELSAAKWAQRFLGGTSISDLTGMFRYAVDDFVDAMTEAGIKVKIDATYRPIQRFYLMHWSWRIVNDGIDPATIPAMAGVEIEWQHPTSGASQKAANEMVDALSIRRLRTAPALRSQHNVRLAIDMSISWSGTVSLMDANGKLVHINSLPRTGMNRQLIEIGATYGVKKYLGGNKDVPHWSNNGR
jgi:biotin operon repressor